MGLRVPGVDGAPLREGDRTRSVLTGLPAVFKENRHKQRTRGLKLQQPEAKFQGILKNSSLGRH